MKVSTIFALLASSLLVQARFKWFGVNESGAEWGDPSADANSVQWPNQNNMGVSLKLVSCSDRGQLQPAGQQLSIYPAVQASTQAVTELMTSTRR